jgi:glycine cleavage system H protein
MKELSELDLPEDIRYTEEHEWARLEDEKVVIGISDYAQDQLGEIVYIDLQKEGTSFGKGETFGVVESVKAVSDLYMPITGEITKVNPELEDSPENVNEKPYDDGWMIEVKPSDIGEFDSLMTRDEYMKMVDELEE